MSKPQFLNQVGQAFGRLGLHLKKHSPEILVVGGVVTMTVGAVLACKATIDAVKVVDEAKEELDKINYAVDHPEVTPEVYTKENAKKDTQVVCLKTGLKLAKIYGPALVVGAAGVTSVLAGHNILNKRSAALAAAYTAIDSGFKEYRGRVIERFGEELDKELKYGVKAEEVEETVVDADGKETTVKTTKRVINGNNVSGYARFWECGNAGWEKDPEHNLWFLRQQQNYANELLRARGHLFLNEVWDMLGMPRQKSGNVVGWIYGKNGKDGYVDFGIYADANKDCVNGWETCYLIDPNVDGPILDLI